jgi:hypothetical protein
LEAASAGEQEVAKLRLALAAPAAAALLIVFQAVQEPPGKATLVVLALPLPVYRLAVAVAALAQSVHQLWATMEQMAAQVSRPPSRDHLSCMAAAAAAALVTVMRAGLVGLAAAATVGQEGMQTLELPTPAAAAVVLGIINNLAARVFCLASAAVAS